MELVPPNIYTKGFDKKIIVADQGEASFIQLTISVLWLLVFHTFMSQAFQIPFSGIKRLALIVLTHIRKKDAN
jgi:hypothetical protein